MRKKNKKANALFKTFRSYNTYRHFRRMQVVKFVLNMLAGYVLVVMMIDALLSVLTMAKLEILFPIVALNIHLGFQPFSQASISPQNHRLPYQAAFKSLLVLSEHNFYVFKKNLLTTFFLILEKKSWVFWLNLTLMLLDMCIFRSDLPTDVHKRFFLHEHRNYCCNRMQIYEVVQKKILV